jgi:hypothetical protein
MTYGADVIDRVKSYVQHQASKSNEDIVDIVAHNHDRLLAVLDGHDEAFTQRRPAEDEWSLRELLRHSIDAAQIVDNIIATLGKGGNPDDPGADATMIADDGRAYADLIAMLSDANASLLRTIAAIPVDAPLETKTRHAFLGQLNAREWCIVQRLHDEDHIQHAGKIIAALGG